MKNLATPNKRTKIRLLGNFCRVRSSVKSCIRNIENGISCISIKNSTVSLKDIMRFFLFMIYDFMTFFSPVSSVTQNLLCTICSRQLSRTWVSCFFSVFSWSISYCFSVFSWAISFWSSWTFCLFCFF